MKRIATIILLCVPMASFAEIYSCRVTTASNQGANTILDQTESLQVGGLSEHQGLIIIDTEKGFRSSTRKDNYDGECETIEVGERGLRKVIFCNFINEEDSFMENLMIKEFYQTSDGKLSSITLSYTIQNGYSVESRVADCTKV